MKKLTLFFAAVATMLGFTSCDDDKDPVYQQPTKFELNTPAMAQQYYELTEGNFTEFTCSQPDYGFVASTTYGIQVSLDKTNYIDIASENPNSATIRVSDLAISTAINVLYGIETPEDWDNNAEAQAVQPIYVRATCMLGNIEKTFITSNWITLERVKAFFAVPQPAVIYLIGDCGGWVGPDEGNAASLAPWALSEKKSDIGSNMFYGTFEIPAGKAMFRFYKALTGWDGGDSLGYKEADESTDFEFNDDGTFQSAIVDGKGNFNFPNWEGGLMTIIVDLNNYTVTMMKGDQN